MEETVQKSQKEKIKRKKGFNQPIKTDSMLNETEGLIRQSEVIIAFYLLGIKPPALLHLINCLNN